MLKRLLAVENWLQTPADREIITRWTRTGGDAAAQTPLASRYTVHLPPLPDDAQNEWEFLALGDTGDADAAGPTDSPQDAVGRQLTRDALPPVGVGRGRMVLHTGDVVYMTGEHRLYERNFRRPYSAFLTDASTIDQMTFRLPFLPVPGNHDYYDLGAWAKWLARVPLLGSGLRAVAHELFAFGLPEGGSDKGRAYMEAFVAQTDGDAAAPYQPDSHTRLPNRYYQFTVGKADFFALDSNTLDAPPPGSTTPSSRHHANLEERKALEARAETLNDTLQREQQARTECRHQERQALARNPATISTVRQFAEGLGAQINTLADALRRDTSLSSPASEGGPQALGAVEGVTQHWSDGIAALDAALSAGNPEATAHALDQLDAASDEACRALLLVEAHLGTLPGGSDARQTITQAGDAVEQGQSAYAAAVEPWAKEMDARIHALSEEALDVQRALALVRRHERYRPEDFDHAQLEWLEAALAESEQARPDHWRIVFLHHPLYTAIGNHAEGADVTGLRENLLPFLQKRNRVHLVLAGHSHAFEWFRSEALPDTGIFVTGGGGQITLRPTLFEEKRLAKNHLRYRTIRHAGIREYASAGAGPNAPDGNDGPLYHHLRLVVRPDVIEVHPVGSRWLKPSGQFRREEPVPVFYADDLPLSPDALRLQTRLLACVEVRRDRPPVARWTTK